MQTKNLSKQFQTLPAEKSGPIKLNGNFYKVVIGVFIVAVVYLLVKSAGATEATHLDYELMVNDNTQAIVLIKEPVSLDLPAAKLSTIADSLYKERIISAIDPVRDSYRVLFYYREDWNGQMYYAGKVWTYSLKSHQMEAQPLDVTGVTGNKEEDDRSMARRHDAAKN